MGSFNDNGGSTGNRTGFYVIVGVAAVAVLAAAFFIFG